MNSWLNKRVKTLGLLVALALLLVGSFAAVQAQSETPAATTVEGELKIFDWNKPVQKSDRGFPWDRSPDYNFNWVSPVNYAGGTIYFRAEVRSMPRPEPMKLQFCFWQFKNARETCSQLKPIQVGQTITWSQPLRGMWKKNGTQLDWAKPRDRNGVAIKNAQGKAVSNYAGWNWNGENPADWYPMNMRFTAVVVQQGKAFSGWNNYIP